MSSDSNSDRDINWKGKEIKNRYIIIKELGRGSYCTVWLTLDFSTGQYFALKIYNRCDYKNARKEIEISNAIKDIGISNVILYNDYFEYTDDDIEELIVDNSDSDSSDSYVQYNIFVMVLMPLCGYSLYEIMKLVRSYQNSESGFIKDSLYDKYIEFTCHNLRNVGLTLNEFHRYGLVHTDIKPENILLPKVKLECLVVIEDINKKIANFKKKKNKIIEYIENTNFDDIEISVENRLQYILGYSDGFILCDIGTTLKNNDRSIMKFYTTYYKAPEIILNLDYDGTYDVWSMGCTLYELITGEILFDPYNKELRERFCEDDNLNLLYLIESTLGELPLWMKQQSPQRTSLYTRDLTCVRGYNMIQPRSYIDRCIGFLNEKNFSSLSNMINNMILYLQYEPRSRPNHIDL